MRWCYPFSNRLAERKGVSNHEAYHSGNLSHIPKLTSSSHVHPFGIKNTKNHCFINVILQLIYSVLRSTQQKIHINNCVEGKILERLFDTARVATLWPGQNSLPFPNLFLTHAPIFPTNEMHSAIFSIQSMIECSMTCIHVSTFCVRGFLNLTPCWEGSTYECHKYACLVSSQWLQGNIDADGTPCFFFQKYFTSINTKMI